jgi:uncharacterized membrane protein (UPF0127 family)
MRMIEITIARHFWSRAIGLLGQHALGERQGLLIVPCDSVHTFFMRWPIDVLFIDRAGNITRIVERLRPWRCAAAPAHSCLELCAGNAAALGLRVGLCLPQLAKPAPGNTMRLTLPASTTGHQNDR